MNTIEGLKKLPSIIEKLLNDRDAIDLQIADCYMPFREIIKEVFLTDGYLYIDDIDIGVGDENVCFALRYRSDDECEGTYKYPIEAFVSADTLREYIESEKIRKEQEAIERKNRKAEIERLECEKFDRIHYERLKKKFEGT